MIFVSGRDCARHIDENIDKHHDYFFINILHNNLKHIHKQVKTRIKTDRPTSTDAFRAMLSKALKRSRHTYAEAPISGYRRHIQRARFLNLQLSSSSGGSLGDSSAIDKHRKKNEHKNLYLFSCVTFHLCILHPLFFASVLLLLFLCMWGGGTGGWIFHSLCVCVCLLN